MKHKFIAIKNWEEDKNNKVLCIIKAESEEEAKEKFYSDIKTYFPEEYKYIKDSLTGREEWEFLSDGCKKCEWADPEMGSCPHSCVQDDDFWFDIVYPIFKDIKTTEDILEMKNGKFISENIDNIIQFLYEENDRCRSGIIFIELDKIKQF